MNALDLKKIIEHENQSHNTTNTINYNIIDTPLGAMIAIANETHLLLLEFLDQNGLDKQIKRFQKKTKSKIILGHTKPIDSIQNELKDYFQDGRKDFKTPIKLHGTDFQKTVWHELIKIASGQTKSYADLARSINQPTAFRAVARANSTNQLAIIVPCHRVINSDGKLGGYAGSIDRKAWLLKHESI